MHFPIFDTDLYSTGRLSHRAYYSDTAFFLDTSGVPVMIFLIFVIVNPIPGFIFNVFS